MATLTSTDEIPKYNRNLTYVLSNSHKLLSCLNDKTYFVFKFSEYLINKITVIVIPTSK